MNSGGVVLPAEAGIQNFSDVNRYLDTGFRRYDVKKQR